MKYLCKKEKAKTLAKSVIKYYVDNPEKINDIINKREVVLKKLSERKRNPTKWKKLNPKI